MNNARIIFVSATLALAFAITSFRISSMLWTADVKNAKIHFTMPKGNKEGTFSGLVASINFDASDPSTASFKASIDVNTVNTGIDKLNEHLKTADFFDAANHPQITFTSSSVEKTDSGFVAKGKLAMRDSIHDISVPFKFNKGEKGQATIIGRMDVFSGDYGVGKKSPSGNDEVVIDIEVPLTSEK